MENEALVREGLLRVIDAVLHYQDQGTLFMCQHEELMKVRNALKELV
jgi:hypothetical protein